MDLFRNFFERPPSMEELLQLLSGLRTTLLVLADAPTPAMSWIFTEYLLERFSPELIYSINLWLWMQGDAAYFRSFPLAFALLHQTYRHFAAILSIIPRRALSHVYSLQVEVHSDDVVPEGFRWFLEHFSGARDLYVDVVDVIESSGRLFTEPPSLAVFVRDNGFVAGTPRLSFRNITLDGAYLSPDITYTLDTSSVVSLSLYNQIIRSPDYMPILRLLELFPQLEVLRCHLHWQFPARQRIFWASAPEDVITPLFRNVHTVDFLGFKNDVADFFNDVTVSSLFKVRGFIGFENDVADFLVDITVTPSRSAMLNSIYVAIAPTSSRLLTRLRLSTTRSSTSPTSLRSTFVLGP